MAQPSDEPRFVSRWFVHVRAALERVRARLPPLEHARARAHASVRACACVRAVTRVGAHACTCARVCVCLEDGKIWEGASPAVKKCPRPNTSTKQFWSRIQNNKTIPGHTVAPALALDLALALVLVTSTMFYRTNLNSPWAWPCTCLARDLAHVLGATLREVKFRAFSSFDLLVDALVRTARFFSKYATSACLLSQIRWILLLGGGPCFISSEPCAVLALFGADLAQILRRIFLDSVLREYF
jgi:hypothetical protein